MLKQEYLVFPLSVQYTILKQSNKDCFVR